MEISTENIIRNLNSSIVYYNDRGLNDSRITRGDIDFIGQSVYFIWQCDASQNHANTRPIRVGRMSQLNRY